MGKIFKSLEGYKTHIAMVGLFLTSFAGFLNGDITLTQLFQGLFASIGGSSIRSGVAKKNL